MRIGDMDAAKFAQAANTSGVSGAFSIYALKKANQAQKETIVTILKSMPIPEREKQSLIDFLA